MSAKETEFLTNEAIEGEPLANRLANAALPAEDALRYAFDIGRALNRAHKSGAVHGQLSPHAILLTASGARIVRPEESKVVDALAYRSPEQVSGESPDWRSDIFSFGTLLYEMVGGRRAFSGEGEALDRIIREKPPASLMSKSPIHAAMEGVIAGCIEKNPARRRQRIQNAVIELRLAGRCLPRISAVHPVRVVKPTSRPVPAGTIPTEPDTVAFPDETQPVPAKPRGQRATLLWVLGFAVLLAALGGWILWQRSHTPPAQAVQFRFAAPENTSYRMPAVSPDGRSLVVQSDGPNGKPILWLLGAGTPTMIPGTEGGFAPFWSPDSQYLAFFADAALKKVHLSDGHAEKICDAEPLAGGGTWNRSGTIVFAPGRGTSLYQVSANGGQPQPLLKLNAAKSEHAHLWPQFLPDGNHFVFLVLSSSSSTTGIYAGSLDSTDYTMLFESENSAVYTPPPAAASGMGGFLLYIRGRSLMRVGFNASHLQLVAEPAMVQDDVSAAASLSLSPIAISQNGVLVYQSVGPPARQLTWTDRRGKRLAAVKEGGDWGAPRISPDGTRAVAAKSGKEQSESDLWLIDAAGNADRFTSGPAHKGSPVWSPDGARIAYYSEINGACDIVVSPSNAGGKVDPLLKSAEPSPTDWSRDSKFLLFDLAGGDTKSDIWALSLADRRSGPVLDTMYSESNAALSPDQKWLAYQSDEAGRNQVYVQPFDGISRTKRRYEVSGASGGGIPRWRADGKELFYMTSDGRVMAMAVHPAGDEFQHDPPQSLFQTPTLAGMWNLFDVAPDGARFLMSLPLEWSHASPITVVTNWTEKVKD